MDIVISLVKIKIRETVVHPSYSFVDIVPAALIVGYFQFLLPKKMKSPLQPLVLNS